jgi:uncharacterized protein (TIGR03663 family)
MAWIKHCGKIDSFIVSVRMMRCLIVTACWIVVAAAGAFLRFEDLAARPFHADEATGARITAKRMETGGSTFDPKHYHGPLLSELAVPLCRARGENSWREMTKGTPRLLTAFAGSLLVLLPLAGARRFGHGAMLAAAALLATSPLLVYYSRMFIHEPLLVLCGMAVVFSLAGGARLGGAGFLTGLMFATKETFAISVLAWSAAGVLLAWENRRSFTRAAIADGWRAHRRAVWLSLAAFLVTWITLYSDFFRHPRGAVDSIRTFFVYETVAGHEKPAMYYLQLLAWPFRSAGMWWFGTPVILLALIAVAGSFMRGPMAAGTRRFIRFLAYSALGHFVIYSAISYKTPWLACLPWAHVCVLAGFAVPLLASRGRVARLVLTAVLLFGIATQVHQARAASGRFASDARNPFAYVPTRRDVEALEAWLMQLSAKLPAGALEPAMVIGTDYWPLPWYLRSLEKTGWWRNPPPDVREAPLVFAMPDAAPAVIEMLAASHVALPRGLRAEVPLMVFVRNEWWEIWMNAEN